jgi:hypothetical protein
MKKMKLVVPFLLLLVLTVSMSWMSVSAQEPRSGGVRQRPMQSGQGWIRMWQALFPALSSSVTSSKG